MRRGMLVVVLVSSAASAQTAPDDFGVACVDATTGTERWRTAVKDGWPPRLRIASGALWERRGDDATWIRRDLATGAVRGRGAPPEIDSAASPYWTTTDGIVREDGSTVVRAGAFVDDLAVLDDLLVFTLDRDDGQVYGAGVDGRLRWVVRPRELVAGFEAGDGARVELLGGRLLVHAPPALLSIDPRTGAVAWSARVPALEGRWGPLRALEAGASWIVAVDGVVVALDAATGAVLWQLDAGEGGATSPVVGSATFCFDRRDERAEPHALDEAEIARAVEIVVEDGRATSVRWVARAELAPGTRRKPVVALPAPGDGARLVLRAPDAEHAVDATSLLERDGAVVVEVAGAWEDVEIVSGP